jgi:hypothetical protein
MWKKNQKDDTLQERLQEQEKKENRMGKVITIAAIVLIVMMCAGGGVFKLRDWAAAQGEIAIATAAVVETRQAVQTATAEANAPLPGWEDPAEIVKLSVEQWYNLDYTGKFEDWAEEMCEYTTRYACGKEVYDRGDVNWTKNVVPKQLQFTADVTPVKMVWEKSYYDADAGRNMDTQIWEYNIVVTGFPGQTTRYVMIADEGAGWRMVHNLWDEEAAQLLQEIAADITPEAPET